LPDGRPIEPSISRKTEHENAPATNKRLTKPAALPPIVGQQEQTNRRPRWDG
jgi:hypothetical protein